MSDYGLKFLDDLHHNRGEGSSRTGAGPSGTAGPDVVDTGTDCGILKNNLAVFARRWQRYRNHNGRWAVRLPPNLFRERELYPRRCNRSGAGRCRCELQARQNEEGICGWALAGGLKAKRSITDGFWRGSSGTLDTEVPQLLHIRPVGGHCLA